MTEVTITERRLDGIRGCVFDAFGTVFDVHSAAAYCRARLPGVADELSNLWRRKQLEYTWLRSLMGRHADFAQVTSEALDYALDTFGIDDGELRGDLLTAYLRLECYPDARETLARMRQGGYKTAILSNGTPAMLHALVEHSGIGNLLDALLSIEEVGVYKPDARVYAVAGTRLGLAPHEISFYSANAWDAAGAASAGLRVVWVNRFAQRRERLPANPEIEVNSLAAVPALLGL